MQELQTKTVRFKHIHDIDSPLLYSMREQDHIKPKIVTFRKELQALVGRFKCTVCGSKAIEIEARQSLLDKTEYVATTQSFDFANFGIFDNFCNGGHIGPDQSEGLLSPFIGTLQWSQECDKY